MVRGAPSFRFSRLVTSASSGMLLASLSFCFYRLVCLFVFFLVFRLVFGFRGRPVCGLFLDSSLLIYYSLSRIFLSLGRFSLYPVLVFVPLPPPPLFVPPVFSFLPSPSPLLLPLPRSLLLEQVTLCILPAVTAPQGMAATERHHEL